MSWTSPLHSNTDRGESHDRALYILSKSPRARWVKWDGSLTPMPLPHGDKEHLRQGSTILGSRIGNMLAQKAFH